jgi:hypothetical protein
MKKLKFLSLLLIPTISMPVIFSITSCSTLQKSYKIIDVNSTEKEYKNLSTPGPSLHSLMWGDKGFNNGNYVLFITHSLSDIGVGFLLNNYTYLSGDNPKLLVGNEGPNATKNLIDAISNYKDEMPDVSYKFVSVIEEDNSQNYIGDSSYRLPTNQPCSPFQKYSEADEKINDKHVNGDYIRNDADAKAYRDLIDTTNKLFKSSNNDFIAIQWVKGYPITDSINTGA